MVVAQVILTTAAATIGANADRRAPTHKALLNHVASQIEGMPTTGPCTKGQLSRLRRHVPVRLFPLGPSPPYPEVAPAVPSAIPSQGVAVDGSFELFPLQMTVGPLQVTSAQQAESVLSSEGFSELASRALSVTAVEASFTFSGFLSVAGATTVNGSERIPAWVVVYTVPPYCHYFSTGHEATNPPDTHEVEVVDAVSGQGIFGTDTP
jgi:hypothetical protein